MSEKEIQQKYLELQILNTHINQLTNQLNILEQQILSLRVLDESMKDIKDVKIGSDILVPLGEGIFINGKLEDNRKVLLNVGNGIVVEKGLDEAKEMVLKQIQEIKLLVYQFDSELNNAVLRSQELQKELIKHSEEH
ncbi:MAG: prefoldin subunit alpha [Nanoarchaeota archaeon]